MRRVFEIFNEEYLEPRRKNKREIKCLVCVCFQLKKQQI